MKHVSLLLFASSVLMVGCAGLPPGWAEYREAMKCDLQNKNEECDATYEKAIHKNPKLPGLQASFASHLYRRGDAANAQAHFNEEMQNHPVSGKAIGVVLGKNSKDAAAANHQ
jgi:hypothetical protein